MKTALRWIGIVLGSLIGLIALAAVFLYAKARLEFSRKYEMQVESVTVSTDPAAIEHGRHLATILCMECHQEDLGGKADWFTGGAMGGASAPNITSGPGGLGREFSAADFVRVLRHGVKPDGTAVFIMPSQDFYYLSDADLGDLIAYIQSAAPVDRQTPEPHVHLTFIGNVAYGAGAFGDLLRAEKIEQMGKFPAAPQPGVTADYGQYLVNVNGCHDCHGAQLAGGKPGDPASPLAPNLTPGGEVRAWSESDFLTAFRTGMTPSGTELRDRFMPWKHKGQMTDAELKAIWISLQALPSLPTSTAPAE